MKKIQLVFFFLATAASAQAVKLPNLTAVDINPTGTVWNVYRAPGPCPSTGTPVFVLLAGAIATRTYIDTTATPGYWCYAVTATTGGLESPKSNNGQAAVPPFTPTLTVVVQ